jgi:hypothetical protein
MGVDEGIHLWRRNAAGAPPFLSEVVPVFLAKSF